MSYAEFIQNILDVRGRFACGDEHHERHHIKPRCMGGDNEEENLIDLFAREHFEAHRLLALENPDNEKIVYAWWMLSNIGDREITSDEYEESKTVISNKLKEFFKNPENHPMYGKHHTNEARKKMSDNHWDCTGENNPNYGKTWWDENTPQEKIDEWKRRLSEALSGENSYMYGNHKFAGANNPMYGKHLTEEHKKKIGDARKGKYCGSNHPRSRKVICLLNLKIYGYLNEAAKENHVSKNTMRKYCLEHKDFMYYDEWLAKHNN